MVLPRPTAIRGFAPARILRASAPRAANRAVVQRRYASSHGSASSGGDTAWLLSAVAITVPAVYYLWPDSSHGDAHGPHAAHAKQAEEHPEPEKEEGQTEEKPTGEEPKQKEPEQKDEKKEQEEPTQDQPQSGKTPAPEESKSKPNTEGANQPENKGDVEGVKFKGPTNEGDEQHRMPDERKREPDGKGAYKKRIDSGYGKNLGEGPAQRDDGSQSAASAKTEANSEPGDINTKQTGLSNTATRHSTDITQDPNMSKKGEGSPETAKSMGTVSVNRPHTEQQKGEGKENNPNPDAAKKDE